MPERPILIVEDEPDIAELIRFHVSREGLPTQIVASGRGALQEITAAHPRLVILDLMLPDLDGLEVCRRLKWESDTRGIPILIVSAKGEDADVVAGLELGADDYVTKPFSPKVLMARMKNILRRQDEQASAKVEPSRRISLAAGSVVIDIDRHIVTVGGREVDLTRTEFGILQTLASRLGFVRTRDQIISAVHGESTVLSSRTVDVHVTAIRRKLGEFDRLIHTVRGVGYRLDDSTGEDES